jgi:hypothetical protein
LALLFFVASAHAVDMYAGVGDVLEAPSTNVRGIDFVLTPNITHDTDLSYTIIEAEVDNIGFEKVLISLPIDWELSGDIYGATGTPIIQSRGALKRKYGDPDSKYSFQRNFFVFTSPNNLALSRGSPFLIEWDDGSVSWGWYIRPNERLNFVIKMFPKEANVEAVIDPTGLEQNRSDIIVNKWNQEFMVFPDRDTPTGFLAAPWIVKDGTMVEATPGVFRNLSQLGGPYNWDKLMLQNGTTTTTIEPEVEEIEKLDPPVWNEWFSSSGLFGLKPMSLASLETDFLPIPEINKTEVVVEEEEVTEEKSVFIPVWLIDLEFHQTNSVGTTAGAAIRYVYEWSRGLVTDDLDVPAQSKPYVTLTERFGETTPPTPSPREDEPDSPIPELDLTTVPEWFSWFN